MAIVWSAERRAGTADRQLGLTRIGGNASYSLYASSEVPVSRRVDAAFVAILVISPATVGLTKTCSSGLPGCRKWNGRGRTVTRDVWSTDKVILG